MTQNHDANAFAIVNQYEVAKIKYGQYQLNDVPQPNNQENLFVEQI